MTWRYRKKDTDTKHVTVYKNINRHGATDFFKEKSNVCMCTKTWTDMVLQKKKYTDTKPVTVYKNMNRHGTTEKIQKKIHWHETCDCVQKHEQTVYIQHAWLGHFTRQQHTKSKQSLSVTEQCYFTFKNKTKTMRKVKNQHCFNREN